MSTQTFDGQDLEDALAKVHRDAGPEARIVSAEKVRSGGLGGFFAKERIEVVVEVDETAIPSTTPAPEVPRRQVLRDPAPTSILELAELRNEEEAHAVPVASPAAAVAPAVPTPAETELDFADILRRIAESTDEAVEASVAFDPPRIERPKALDPAPPPPPRAAPTPPPAPRPLRRVTPAVERSRLVHRLGELGLPADLVPTDPEKPLLAALAAHLAEHLARPAALPVHKGAVVAVVGARSDALGLARTLATRAKVDGATVVLAGPTARQTRGASSILRTPAQALAERPSWRRRSAVTFVALDAGVGRRADCEWAWRMLEALEPHAVWGSVPAHRKTDDLVGWSEALGGVDVLALTGLEETSSPAGPLHLGVPVALLDDDDATPDRWARLLTDRIATA